MHETIETQSIFFINTLSKVEEDIVQLLPLIDEMRPPSETLSMSGDILKGLKQIDGGLSVLRANGTTLFMNYKSETKRYLATYNSLVTQINDRKATGDQLNTMAELYDGEHFLKNIGDTPGEPVELKKPEDYSVLAIVNHMHKFMSLIKDCGIHEVELDSRMKLVIETLVRCLDLTLKLRNVLVDVNFATTMATDYPTEDTKRYLNLLGNSIGTIRLKIRSIKEMVTRTFQMYLAMNNNFDIYEKAVNTLTSTALESMLNPFTLWEIM